MAAKTPRSLELVRTASEGMGSSYGDIVVGAATSASMKSILGKPISAKERSCLWIGTDGCRRMGLKLVRANFTEDGTLSHMTLDLQQPYARADVVEKLKLGEPADVRKSKDITIELFLPMHLALGVHDDRVIRLYLFGIRTPGVAAKKPASSREEREELLGRVWKAAMEAATPEEKDKGLREAVLGGDAKSVARYLAAGASPMTADSQGATTLHHGARLGHDAIIASLVFGTSQPTTENSQNSEQGASAFNALLDKQDNDGATALHLACLGRQVDAAKALLRMGADPNVADVDGQRPLHIAVLAGNVDLVEALLLARADVYRRTNRGYLALDLATNKEIRLLLTQATTRVGDDPAKAKVTKVVESFLRATCDGDIDKMKSCVLPSVHKGMPDRIGKTKIQWSVKRIEFEPAAVRVECEVTPPDGLSQSPPVRVGFRLEYADGVWRIAEFSSRPHTTVTEKQGDLP